MANTQIKFSFGLDWMNAVQNADSNDSWTTTTDTFNSLNSQNKVKGKDRESM